MAWKSRRKQVERIAEVLLKVGALQFGAFILPDGSSSPYYVNLRSLPSYPGAYRAVVESLTDMIRSKAGRFDALCGIPLSGLLLASPVCLSLAKPMVYLRTGQGQEGKRSVEGELRPGWNVLLVDDLVMSGGTLVSSAQTIEQEGGKVTKAVVLIDRLEGGRERLSKRGISLLALTDMMELADTLFAMDLITEESLKAITKRMGGR